VVAEVGDQRANIRGFEMPCCAGERPGTDGDGLLDEGCEVGIPQIDAVGRCTAGPGRPAASRRRCPDVFEVDPGIRVSVAWSWRILSRGQLRDGAMPDTPRMSVNRKFVDNDQ